MKFLTIRQHHVSFNATPSLPLGLFDCIQSQEPVSTSRLPAYPRTQKMQDTLFLPSQDGDTGTLYPRLHLACSSYNHSH